MQFVDLMGAGVVQLVAFEIDLGTPEALREARRERERARTSDVVLQ